MRHLLSKYVLAVVAVTVALVGFLAMAMWTEQASLTSAAQDGRRQLLVEQRYAGVLAASPEIHTLVTADPFDAGALTPLLRTHSIAHVRVNDRAVEAPGLTTDLLTQRLAAVPFTASNEDRITTFFRTNDIDAAVKNYVPTLTEELAGLRRNIQQQLLLGALAVLLLGIAIALYGAHHMVKPLRRLAEQAGRIGRGDFA